MKTTIPLLGIFLVLMTAACGTISGRDGLEDPGTTEGEFIDFVRLTEFDGRVLTIDLSHRDGSTTTVNTVRDAEETSYYVTPIPGHSGRRWRLFNTAHDSTSLVYALVSWNNDDPTDYLAAGWWHHFPGKNPPDLYLRDAEISIFVDGPEIDLANPPELPLEGQATYGGVAGGAYLYVYGSDWGNLTGAVAVEEYEATMAITADFSKNTMQGCLGCEGDIITRRSHLGAVLGDEVRELVASPADYELHFGPTPFNSDGTFEHTELTVTHPDRAIEQSSGFWGGQFSNRPDTAGNPRLVTGFNEAEFAEADGSIGYFLGIFNALSEPFGNSGERQVP